MSLNVEILKWPGSENTQQGLVYTNLASLLFNNILVKCVNFVQGSCMAITNSNGICITHLQIALGFELL